MKSLFMLKTTAESTSPRHRISLSVVVVAFLLAACSGDPGPDPGPMIPGTNQNAGTDVEDDDTNGINDKNDADPESDTDDGQDADDEDDGVDDPDKNQGNQGNQDDSLCGEVIDLGLLTGSFSETLTVEFQDADDRFQTTCQESQGGRAEVIFQYRLEGDGKLSVSSADDVILELRGDACVNQQAIECGVSEIRDYIGWPTQYLLVEKLTDETPDTVEITLSYEQFEACEVAEIGQAECIDASRISACDVTFASPDRPNWLEFDCPTGCENDRCLGDSCSAPIIVTESSQFTALQHVLQNVHNSVDTASCGPDGGAGEDLEGRELVFEFPNLSTGSEVIITATQESYYIGQEISLLFKDSCDDGTACLDFHKGDGTYTFVAPAAGTYYLFVDLPMDFDGETSVNIEIRDN